MFVKCKVCVCTHMRTCMHARATIIDRSVNPKSGNVLPSSVPISFPRSILHHGICWYNMESYVNHLLMFPLQVYKLRVHTI
jgi:hypothetical protein